MTVLQVNGLQIKRGERQIIDNLSFQIEEGQRFFVQGEIGTGKTTLLLALLGFAPVARGEIRLFGQLCLEEKDFAPFRGTVGLCFQHADDQLFGPTVLDDVAFGPLNQGLSRQQAYAVALQQLERLGIAHLQERYAMTILLVSHSMDDVARYAEEVFVLNQGECIRQGSPEEVFSHKKEMEELGLGLPQIRAFLYSLEEKGLSFPKKNTVEEAKAMILSAYKKRKGGENA